ncbi:phospholipase (plasmid) [Haloferax mediterranei ATCC 33500]|uniref:Phospholipase n=1 Tax=Haloferax mediterranei (strain ATCC 33500 / DSM 1411 / JCM 8866 / NBRC 14739 / NCIMB 2177 / R-4) TaxID=523841 RepID=I3RBJ3_HALMT|nr:dienelactone hydrolase family protein [Haloferax mediterranei]AFK21603.1 phospholipase/carboxylesterase [Haloferax mediterranei ATCC 33500]AHZ24352.1 phospholipase [Haloferax mediterranei ATCC 33500]ELZ97087.1 phospholipase/carboxylesterase [Haloferax mediterranei ATCC 33500]MDX5990166.1 dienelactone hydrolase family protein [Haloferax mediterranei ATCC 33500]QCQ76759.1 phospholipase [Haloferax mediterranei ATCC 33500]
MGRNTDSTGSEANPHEEQPIETAGAPPQAAEAAVILLHGRGSTAQSILTLIDEFLHHGVMYLAPQAAHKTWYPRSGYAPIEDNEPWFSSGLARISTVLEKAAAADIPPERTLLLGFSQGGCLASEFVARNPRRYGGLVVLSGSLLGPDTRQDYDGFIDGTPVFLGCSSDDPYVAADRIHESARVFEQLGGDVRSRLYDDLGHAINDDEIQLINTFIERLV